MNALKTISTFALAIFAMLFVPLVTMAAVPVLTTPTTGNLGANQVTLTLQASQSGTGYFTLLPGSDAACGTGTQVKNGQNSSGTIAYRHGSLPLTANSAGRYTVRNLLQSSDYTVCFTADDGTNLQETPATAGFTTAAAINLSTSAWTSVGSNGVSEYTSSGPSLSFAPDGTPYVAYSNLSTTHMVAVKKYDDAVWVDVGNAGFSAGAANHLSLSFAPDGTPYVAYQDSGNDDKATVKKYNGTSWVDVGSAGFSVGEANFTSLSFAPDGTPYVAYEDSSNAWKATVKKYNGTAWVVVGSPGFSTGPAEFISFSVAPDGTPYVAYIDWSIGFGPTVKKYDGEAWVNVGSDGVSEDMNLYTSLSFAPDGTPYVAYQDWGNNGGTTVKKYEGAAWVGVGSAGFSAGEADFTSLSFAPNGTPYVAYRNYDNKKATVKKYNGVAWTDVASAEVSAAEINNISISFAPDGTPYVAFEEDPIIRNTVVMKLTPVYTVTYDGNGGTVGSVPLDSNTYVQGAAVTVLSNSGTLMKTGYIFEGWNTVSDGSGTSYAASGSVTFTMGSADVTLYAQWTPVPATLTVTISGTGSVTSQNQLGTNYTCNSGSCAPATFNLGDTVTLTATGSNSIFNGWSGAITSSVNPYTTLLMDANKAVTASFTPAPATVKIDGSDTVYYSINAALVASALDAVIRAKETSFSENVIMENSHILILKGGYSDANFSSQTGYSTINGTLTIKAGKLIVDRVVVGP
ncbi:MAG: InlB B-repeat-containing protein [Trichlorobacter sp.]|uniref:InlB B-repeat-containing protein n=1 Tax=Trichlorobacter sp. TaxID=2911007 RepID=UPI00256B7FA5|nr:InlB B-repeat-containing protein [Trichlorobacter sp.]MDK9717614.1 InlB B-repeat-containing protein [Trichlorobacter sp.]